MHQKHHERPKDEEGDIAELEKEGGNMGRGLSDRGGGGGLPLVITQSVTYHLSGS